MRIIAGMYKSRTLIAPKGDATRPTTDRARESLFNVLQHLIDLEGIEVLDLFAGSGALAMEALSRGAKEAVLVERDRRAITTCQENVTALGATAKIIAKDVFSYLRQPPRCFDLIFADPPYDDAHAYADLLDLVVGRGWLAEEGRLIIEHRSTMALGVPAGAVVVRELKAGEATFTILEERAEAQADDRHIPIP